MGSVQGRIAAQTARAEISRMAILELRQQVIDILDQANTKSAKTLVALAEAVESGFDRAGDKLGKANMELAILAHEAVKTAYDKARQRGAGTGPYRSDTAGVNRRYAGHALEAALAEPGFVTGDDNAIYFADVAGLDSVAKQWWRLNFGAGGAAGSGPGPYTIRWSNLDAISLGFEDSSPSKAFSLPAGRWRNDEFMPAGAIPEGWTRENSTYQPPANTRGIRGEHWLEAGLAAIALGLPQRYAQIFNEIWEEAVAKGTAGDVAGSTTLRRPGRPKFTVAPFNERDPRLSLGPAGGSATGGDRAYPGRGYVGGTGGARQI